MLWITVTLLLGMLILMPLGGVALHLYLYRHHPVPTPRPQPLSEIAQMMRLHHALFSDTGSYE